MHTTAIYYLILFVYISLWSCQVVACHLTHSLIILTDSYINLYKVLDISLGIVHLHTQNKVKKLTAKGDTQLEVQLFGRICTYQFKRLPIIGTFVNGLFLAALLVSAAIEGIQTCFHASHLAAEGEPSILLEHPLTYPSILVGFAAVGLLMQWSSNKAHRLREEELESESLLDMRESAHCEPPVQELTVQRLSPPEEGAQSSAIRLVGNGPVSEKRRSICLGKPLSLWHPDGELSSTKFSLKSARHGSFESVPTNLSDAGRVSLKSLKMIDSPNLYNPQALNINSISADVEARQLKASAPLVEAKRDCWQLVRYCISPVALILCAAIVYLARQGSLSPNSKELVTELADSSLAILVVTLLFTASYPPMKKAGKIILQSAPNEIDVEALRSKLKSANELIVDIRELHVWSLTARSNRVATCHVVVNRNSIHSENQLSILLEEVKFKFLENNIKCSTIQPIFLEPTSSN